MSLIQPQNLLMFASYISSIKSLQDVLVKIAAAIGGVIIVYGGIKFALAFQKLDQQGEHQATFTIVAGGVLLGLSGIVSLLGA